MVECVLSHLKASESSGVILCILSPYSLVVFKYVSAKCSGRNSVIFKKMVVISCFSRMRGCIRFRSNIENTFIVTNTDLSNHLVPAPHRQTKPIAAQPSEV